VSILLENYRKTFPKDFLWGSASAAYQIEGGWNEGGKSPSVWDEFVEIPGKTFKGTTGKVAVDHYHRFEEDIQLMAELGLKTYRFSIAWSRIYPNSMDEVNEEGIQFYQNIIDLLVKNDIQPMVTVFHWDLPAYLQEAYRGWENRQIVEDFEKYVVTLFERFGEKVKYWITLNEQNVFTRSGWLNGEHPPGLENETKTHYQVNHHAFLAHARAVERFHEIIPDGMVGPSFNFHPSYTAESRPEDYLAKQHFDYMNNYWWLDVYGYGRYPKLAMKYLKERNEHPEIADGDMELLESAASKIDFIGVNYYRTDTVAYNPKDGITSSGKETRSGEKGTSEIKGIPGLYKTPLNPHLSTTDWDWTIDPIGLRVACREITSRYDLPIIISENGLGAFDKLEEDNSIKDTYRIEYLRDHLKEVKKAIDEGSEVLAYCSWSFTDLLSWLNGYQKRYGLVYIDQSEDNENPTLDRYKKDSYYWYQEVIDSDGKTLWDNEV
jgi:6-phospho-beta-glucosidase